MVTALFFLSSGLFLGWSLGANDAANVFGTAVGTKMIKFKTAALICSIFVVLGAVASGSGASHTLGKLGAVNAFAGSFTVAFAAGLSVFWMTKLKLPVSTSQAIVGAIIGWNFFSGSVTDLNSLTKIISTWIICPLLAGVFSIIFYKIIKYLVESLKIHLLRLDFYTRAGLLIAGAFGSYSLGANNIANVMGVFVPASPFKPVEIGIITLSSAQQLFFLGGAAIAAGVYTYSHKVMSTVGKSIFRLSPVTAFIVVLSSSTVLFLFASEGLKAWLTSHGLPSLPLVPVSSSQAVVGAVLGIGIAKSGRNIKLNILGNISLGWITTPVISGIISFVLLFIMQNVFMQEVYTPVEYKISDEVITKLIVTDNPHKKIEHLNGVLFDNAVSFKTALEADSLSSSEIRDIMEYSELHYMIIDKEKVFSKHFGQDRLTAKQKDAVRILAEKQYNYKWQLEEDLVQITGEWSFMMDTYENRDYNRDIQNDYKYLFDVFRIEDF